MLAPGIPCFRDKIIFHCERLTEACIYLIFFTLTFSKAAVEIFVIIALSSYVLRKLLKAAKVRRQPFFPKTKLNVPILAFILANLISVIASHDKILSAKAFLWVFSENIAIYFMAYETFQSVLEKKRMKIFLGVVLLASISLVFDSAMQYFTGKDIFRHFIKEGPRIKASFGSPNSFGAWLALITPLILCWSILGKFKRNISRVVLLSLGVLLIICLFLTYSRGAWIGFIFALIFMVIFKEERIVLLLLILFIFFSALIFIFPNCISWFDTQYAKYAVLIRFNLWHEAANMIKDYPFFGVGLKNYLVVVPGYQIHKFDLPISQIGESTGLSPHNSYLHMVAELGFVGLSCFLWMVATLFYLGFKLLKRKLDPMLLGVLAGLIAFLVTAFFDNHLRALELSALFWIMVAFTMALIESSLKSSPNPLA